MRERRDKQSLLTFIFLLLSFMSMSQEIQVKGGFLEDSLLIGQDINFYLTATYPPSLEMVFPDSNASFAPFEYSAKLFFPTEMKGELAYDSTIYTLQSFEIDPVQYLQLATAILDGADSTVIKSNIDSIYLTELAPMVSDTTQLIANADYFTVDRAFNYSLFYIILGAVVLVVIILLVIFGKRIVRYFKLRKLKNEYESFSRALTEFIRELKKRPDPDTAEYALNTWKKYQEKLEKFPFTKLTTREIVIKDFNKELEKPLKSIDRLIYGKRETETVYQDFQQIEDFTQHRYNKKVEEIKYGK